MYHPYPTGQGSSTFQKYKQNNNAFLHDILFLNKFSKTNPLKNVKYKNKITHTVASSFDPSWIFNSLD